MLTSLLLWTALAQASEGVNVPPPNRLTSWQAPLRTEDPGTRVGMIVETIDARPVDVEVWQGERWVAAAEIYRDDRVAVLVADLGRSTDEVQLHSRHTHRIVSLDWDLFVPLEEERRPDFAPLPTPGVLPDELVSIGVTSRAEWGASATSCTTLEDDWYRMAVHHTAGSQTYGGTVEGSVRALQAYAMGSGGYCDVPYQFLVGYDGSLWEGRPYDYYSGATGGGNNDGNIAVCFLGCYHPSGCSTSHEVTDAMMESGQLLVQTLVELHEVPSDESSIRGHRDWPDNATACPGDWLYARLDELRTPLAPRYAAELVSTSFPLSDEGSVVLQVDEAAELTLELLNVGRESWTPGVTNLGTIPRDDASPLASPDWLSDHRPTTVDAETAPGGTGTFSFSLQVDAEGEHTLALGLVQEGETWFADDGGPEDGFATARVVVLPAEDPQDTGIDSGGAAGRPAWKRVRMERPSGCACNTPGTGAAGMLIVALLLGGTARRRG